MNFLHLIKARQEKQARLFEAQYMMAKAYRGIPYSEAPSGGSHGHADLRYRGISYSV